MIDTKRYNELIECAADSRMKDFVDVLVEILKDEERLIWRRLETCKDSSEVMRLAGESVAMGKMRRMINDAMERGAKRRMERVDD